MAISSNRQQDSVSQATRLKKVLNALVRMFALMRVKQEPETLNVWANYLIGKLSLEEIGAACRAAIEDPAVDPYRFTVAKLMAYVKPKIDSREQGLMEWQRVLSRLQARGAGAGLPDDADYATRMAVKSLGGLPYIGNMPQDKLGIARAQFLDAFQANQKAGVTGKPEQLTLPSGEVKSVILQLSEQTNLDGKGTKTGRENEHG